MPYAPCSTSLVYQRRWLADERRAERNFPRPTPERKGLDDANPYVPRKASLKHRKNLHQRGGLGSTIGRADRPGGKPVAQHGEGAQSVSALLLPTHFRYGRGRLSLVVAARQSVPDRTACRLGVAFAVWCGWRPPL